MHELKNQKQSLQKDLIEKVESLEKEKEQLKLEKLKMQEDNDIVLQSKDQQITALIRKIEDTEVAMKNEVQNVDKQNKLCRAKDKYIWTFLNKISVLEKQKAKQQDVNRELEMQIEEFQVHEIELELIDIRVHEEKQKRKAKKSLISPNLKIIALKRRERWKNTEGDFVYEEVKKKTKIAKELFIDVDDSSRLKRTKEKKRN
ncbi:hypothetical protein RHSIM_Rhsim11G0039300 [Rhododendron simsii]|uniref:Uncharacterized protein n=1 Tax=Rhododendron simsii TaxID=118357 RepID=A0A834LA31_RHOSS|nr:hypothetical protein RHSIM_Rhsim11G0039300 [Rhododendron simsii]